MKTTLLGLGFALLMGQAIIAQYTLQGDDVVVENVHRHIGEKYCLEIFIGEGNYQRILDLIGRIRGMRGIQQIKAMFMSL